VAYEIAPNSGAARTGTVTIAGQTFTVVQAAAAAECSYAVNPTTVSTAASGGGGNSIAVTTAAACTWNASSDVSWVTITSGTSGTGNGNVQFSVAANTAGARHGTLHIAGQTVTVSQAAGCTYSLANSNQSIAAAGGAAAPVGVNAASGCAWTASSNAAWISITAGTSGSGSGSVAFTVAANTGPARSGTLTIAGETYTVSQAAGCAFSISPTSQSVGAGGGPGAAIAVTTAAGCSWTSSSNASWITVTSGGSGSGNGSVAFTVSANPGAARSGTITIAGQTFTVSQAAAVSACTYSISRESQAFDRKKDDGSVTVTAGAGCAWTAAVTSGDSWISITSGTSGTGNGTVTYSVANNPGDARTGTLLIAGHTFTITQEAKD
jgi:hypothetical protein